MPDLNAPRKIATNWVPEGKRTPDWYIFNPKFRATVPYIHSMSADYVKQFGTPTSGDRADDRAMLNERIDTMMTIDEMVEYYRKGVVVGVKLRDDVIKIYQHVTNYLVHWNRILTTQINILDAPFEDLELMNQFADAVYDHAKWDLPKVDHEEFVFMDQSPISNTSILQGTRGEINHEDGEYVPPQRDSFAEAFSQVQESLNYNFYSGRNRGK